MAESAEELKEQLVQMRKRDLREGQVHLGPLEELFQAAETSEDLKGKDKIRMMSEIALMLGECNYWIVWFDLAEKGKEGGYCAEARSWYEVAHFMLEPIKSPGIRENISEINLRLDPIEKEAIMRGRDPDIKNDILGYLAEHGLWEVLRIENRLKAIPDGDRNRKAILLLKKANCLYKTRISAPEHTDWFSADRMAYGLCKTILDMQDDGADLWPGIIHKTVLSMLMRCPKIEYGDEDEPGVYRLEKKRYKELSKLLERGIENAKLMGDEFRSEAIYAFASAVRGQRTLGRQSETSRLHDLDS